jgi:PAS domain S-box-containing protein
MKIRTQFILTLLLFGLILLGMVGSLILTNQRVDRLLQQEEIADRIEHRASELNYLSGDYLIYGESQQRARWEASFALFTEDISKLEPFNSEQQTMVAHIQADQDRLQDVFKDVVATIEAAQSSGATPDPAFIQVAWSRMEVQNQSTGFEASAISQKLRAEAEGLRRMNLALMFLLIGIFGAYLLTNYYLIDRRTLRSITELRAGTEIIGSGNLDFTITVKRADEIGDLSRAVNQMTTNLKAVTASQADLQREIEERQRAEDALQDLNEELQAQAEELQLRTRELQTQKNELISANEQFRLSEEVANQRRMEIQAANEELRSARLAALNLMEDTLTVQEQIKEANTRLRESEQRLRRAQEIAHLGSWELDLSMNQLTWSDEVYRIFGLQPQEFGATYEAFLEAVHPDDRAAVDNAYSSSIRDGKDAYEIEHRVIRRHSGEVRVVHEKCEHFRDEAGQIIRSAGMVHDVTERKLAEEQLERSNQKLNEILESIQDDFYVLDREWNFVYVNRLFTSRVDKTPQDFVGNNIWQMFPNHVGSVLEENFRAAMEKREVRRFEISGEYMTAWYRMRVFPSAEGITVLGTDITERKRAEVALRLAHEELEQRVEERTAELAIANRELLNEIAERREFERQLRIQMAAMDAAANGIVITDPQGYILWTNPAITQVSGYSADELVGQNTRIFNSGQHASGFYGDLWSTILSGDVWKGEIINRRKDGSQYVEGQTITPVLNEDGGISNFIAIKEDITEKKQAEQAMRARDEREKMLTQTIHTMQLDIARDLHDTLGQNISFLRMKLAFLAGRKIRKQADLQVEIQTMAQAADESYDLMRGTLAILQSVDSTDLYRLFTRYTEQIEERAGFQVDFCSQGEPRPISAPRMRQLFYIFREVLNNIEKHAHASQVTIEMTWAVDHLKLIVSDNGQGFDVNQVQVGSHYGLRFLRERAELLNGVLTLRSEPGSGAQVAVLIPYETS